jgi:hypothetical protein
VTENRLRDSDLSDHALAFLCSVETSASRTIPHRP